MRPPPLRAKEERLSMVSYVDSIAHLPGLSALLSSFSGGLSDGFLGAFLRRGLCCFRHDDDDKSMTIMSWTDAFIDSPMLIFKEIWSLLIACFHRPNP